MGTGGGYEVISITPNRCARKRFRQLLHLLTSRSFFLCKKVAFCEACVRSVMLYGGETRPVKDEDITRLHRMSMLRERSHVNLRDMKGTA